jgi:hypothetical protein
MVSSIQSRVARALRLASEARELAHGIRDVPNQVFAERTVRTRDGDLVVRYVGRQLSIDTFRHFGHDVVDEKIRSLSLRELLSERTALQALIAGADLGFVDPMLALFLGFQHAPVHVPFARALLPVQRDVDAQIAFISSDGYSRRLKKLARKTVPVTVDASSAAFERFYTTMYEPLAKSRFQRDALLDKASLEHVFARDGRILFIEEQHRQIGAFIYESRRYPGMLSFLRIGTDVPPTDPNQHTEMMATAEIAVFAHAIASGCHTLDFGLTFASPRNGIFVHKRRLGCSFVPFPGYPHWRVVVGRERETETLSSFPLFLLEREGLVLRMGFDGPWPDADDKTLPSLVKDVNFEGLARIEIHCRPPHPTVATRSAVADALASHGSGRVTPVTWVSTRARPVSTVPHAPTSSSSTAVPASLSTSTAGET